MDGTKFMNNSYLYPSLRPHCSSIHYYTNGMLVSTVFVSCLSKVNGIQFKLCIINVAISTKYGLVEVDMQEYSCHWAGIFPEAPRQIFLPIDMNINGRWMSTSTPVNILLVSCDDFSFECNIRFLLKIDD